MARPGRRYGGQIVVGLIVATLLATLTAAAWEREPLEVFRERRARLLRETGGDGIVVLFGFGEEDLGVRTTPFRQNENFYYLTGWTEPDAILLLVPKVAKASTPGQTPEIARDILFVPARDARAERWTGPKLAPEDADAAARTGFGEVKSTTRFQAELQEALQAFANVYTELTPQPEAGEKYFVEEVTGKLRGLAPFARFVDLRPTLTRLRMVKSAGEIALIRKATEASIEAHLAAMKAVRPGVWEYEVAALMKLEFERRGCEWPGYPPIVGSGFYSTVLHYAQNSRRMEAGDLVVMDVAGAYSGYSSDITRTLPVSGRFTPRQRELYQVVLGALNAAVAAAKPGMTISRRGPNSLHLIAYDYINSHGKDLQDKPLGQYFIHGLSHHVGLNVHDPADPNRPLEPGMVITVEPGIYIPEENIGIRIEDVILITDQGAEVLSQRLPRDPDEIEKLMSAK